MSATERRSTGSEANGADTTADRTRRTPSTDMQAEDAGTAASGNESTGRSADTGKKQEHKGSGDTGSRR